MKYFFYTILISVCLVDCAYAHFSDADLYQDGVVDYLDLQMLSSFWLDDCYQSPCYNIDTKEDGLIDFYDFTYLSGNWKITDHNSFQVAYWPFNEGSGTVAHDSTANGHNAAFRNMTSSAWIAGKRQGALQFDGSDDYLSISETSNGLGQYFKKDFSIALWINQYSPQTDYQVPIGIESTSRFEAYGFEGFTIEIYNGVPSIYIAYADDQREIVPATAPLLANQWQHLCVVRDGPLVKIYYDGKLNTSQVITDANIKFGSAWPGYDVIGATKDSYYDVACPFKGKLDDIHLYNFAIPESLIHKLAQQDYAWLPEPENGSANVFVESSLSWQKGTWPRDYNCHDVYLGTDYNQVFTADINTAQIYKGRQTSRLYDPCNLNPNTFYYWRVDDFNGTQIHKGSVWSFKTSDSVSSIEASSSQPGYGPGGAYDGYRFEGGVGKCWKGIAGQGSWSWQINFSAPRQIGSVLMIMGEPGDPTDKMRYAHRNAPSNYKWQYSNDGSTWYDLAETVETSEGRLFRIHRFNTAIVAEHFRLVISGCVGSYPTIREIELYNDVDADIAFDDWLVAVDITNEAGPPYGNTEWFIELARRCSGWGNVQGQQIWVADFNEAFLDIEPYPLCVFLSGSFDEWCQVNRSYFTGLQEVVVNGHIPMWGSCGGAQVLGLLIDPGSEHPWDCPRCRLQHSPAWSPIYRHIGYINPSIEPQACGDYSNCIYESGAYLITKVTSDPVFAGLSEPFWAFESHCGELSYLPTGWHRIGGPPSGDEYHRTYNQCFRRDDRYIYGAQFHIENNYNSETNSNAAQIMTNFLGLAQQWGGYNPP
jgi:hypothetical protein